MNKPEWLKPALFGAAIGAIAISTIGFSWAGWVTGDKALKMAHTASDKAVVAALVPVCLDMASRDRDRVEKLATIRDAESYKRPDAVIEAGWATVPGAEKPSRDLAHACLTALNIGTS